MSDNLDDFLAHYGIKGMKWGVRRKTPDAPTDASKPSSPKLEGKKGHLRVIAEASYIRKGFSPSEAAIKADKAIRIQKVVAISLGVSVAALGTYVVARKLGKEFVGVNIKKDTVLQHLSKSDKLDLDVNRHLYATFNRADKFNYQGTFSTEMGGLTGQTIHNIKLKAATTIKAPSNAQGKKILSQVTGKKESTDEYRSFVGSFFRVDNEDVDYKKFKNTMLNKGFNAVIDTTDQNFYAKAYKPIIVFNSGSNLVEKGSRALTKSEIAKKLLTVTTSRMLTDNVPTIAAGSAMVGVLMGVNSRTESMRIDKYYRDNPGSKLTRSQVALALDMDKAYV